MTHQDFIEFVATVDGTAVSYQNQEDGTTIVTCKDGVQLIVTADGDSRMIEVAK